MIPFFQQFDAIGVANGTWIKPGGVVAAYVRSTGLQEGDDLFAMSGNLVSTINQGLARCRSGKNDIVYVLPGHTESITAADGWSNIVAGAQIVSAGKRGASNNPTVTFSTSTAAQILVDVADVSIVGLNLVMNGIDNIVLPISVTAAGFTFANNEVTYQTAAGVAQPVDGLALGSGANYATIANNRFLSEDNTDQNTGSVILVGTGDAQGLIGVDIVGNHIIAATPGDTDGIIHVASTGRGVRIVGNELHQLATTGDTAIRADNVACRGSILYNFIRLTEDLTAPNGIILGGGTWLVSQNFVSAGNGFAVQTPATDS